MSGKPLREGRPHTAPVPSSRYAYVRYGCRCDDCRRYHAESQAEQDLKRQRSLADGAATPKHGTVSTYDNYRCRCDACLAAKSLANAAYRHQKAAQR